MPFYGKRVLYLNCISVQCTATATHVTLHPICIGRMLCMALYAGCCNYRKRYQGPRAKAPLAPPGPTVFIDSQSFEFETATTFTPTWRQARNPSRGPRTMRSVLRPARFARAAVGLARAAVWCRQRLTRAAAGRLCPALTGLAKLALLRLLARAVLLLFWRRGARTARVTRPGTRKARALASVQRGLAPIVLAEHCWEAVPPWQPML